MKTSKTKFGFSQKLIVLALSAALSPVYAADDEVAKLISPDITEVSLGLGYASGEAKDRALFGQYSGLRADDFNLLLDGTLVRRDDATGTWTRFDARNLGLDGRELYYAREQQGNWKFAVGFGESVRLDPRTVMTSVQNLGTDRPAIVGLGVLRTEHQLDLTRKSFELSGNYRISERSLIEANWRSENKTGARASGIGGFCSNVISGYRCDATVGALLFVTEPVDASTQQLDLRFSYDGDSANLHGGYYGSFYANHFGTLNPTISGSLRQFDSGPLATGSGSGASLASLLTQPYALAPDNSAHQLYLDGNAQLLSWLKGNFNLSHTRAVQDQAFAVGGLSVAGLPSSLGAEVSTFRAQAGFTGRPWKQVSVRGNVRYEEIDDATPIANYREGGSKTNWAQSGEKVRGLAEVSYHMPQHVRLTLGVDYDYTLRQRPVDTAGIPATSITAIREWTEGAGYRAEVRRNMSEDFNASLSWRHEWREGERWMSLSLPGFPRQRWVDSYTANGTFPMNMMDRKRDTLRLAGDWMPADKVSLQFYFDDGKDFYSALSEKGLKDTGNRAYGIDGSWEITSRWKLNGYWSQSRQTLRVDHSWGYMADLRESATQIGIGIQAAISEGFDFGASLSRSSDVTRYDLASANADSPGELPDVRYRQVALRAYGRYALAENVDLRVDLIHQRTRFNEWTWGYGSTPFNFADDTVVVMAPKQDVSFIGAKYVYRFQ